MGGRGKRQHNISKAAKTNDTSRIRAKLSIAIAEFNILAKCLYAGAKQYLGLHMSGGLSYYVHTLRWKVKSQL